MDGLLVIAGRWYALRLGVSAIRCIRCCFNERRWRNVAAIGPSHVTMLAVGLIRRSWLVGWRIWLAALLVLPLNIVNNALTLILRYNSSMLAGVAITIVAKVGIQAEGWLLPAAPCCCRCWPLVVGIRCWRRRLPTGMRASHNTLLLFVGHCLVVCLLSHMLFNN